jgi:hypothetical protein
MVGVYRRFGRIYCPTVSAKAARKHGVIPQTKKMCRYGEVNLKSYMNLPYTYLKLVRLSPFCLSQLQRKTGSHDTPSFEFCIVKKKNSTVSIKAGRTKC